jgi:hypothetical protein
VRQGLLVAALLVCVVAAPRPARAQQPPPPPPPPANTQQKPPPPPGAQQKPPPPHGGALRVFVDCDYCDFDFLRREITFIDYVRERQDAEVHILVTAQGTGGGGQNYTLNFLGQKRFERSDIVLHYASGASDTADTTRKGLAQVMKMGLMRYVAETPLAGELQITRTAPKAGQPGPAAPARDPWDYWSFRSGISLYGNGEKSNTSASYSGSFSANRVTDALKVQLAANGRYSESDYELEEGQIYTSLSRNLSASGSVVWSLTPHWSTGVVASASSATYTNQRMALRLGPALEYNLFPYSESARRQLTFTYALNARHNRYIEETIYEKTREGLFNQALEVSLALKQPWGSTNTSFEAANYLHDRSKNHLELFHGMNVQLFKGFSFNVYASVSRIHDQLYLPKGEATTEEILVRRRQLATSYYYYYSVGFSYRFGSIHNNIVNTRLRSIGSDGGATVVYF